MSEEHLFRKGSDMDVDTEAAIVALLTLAKFNIPPDIQELLVQGNPERNIPPGALSAAIKMVLRRYAIHKLL